MATLVLLRHGESAWNLENRFTGWVDVPLSPKGEEEARQAGQSLSGYRFDQAFTSKLTRAQETLRIVLDVLGQQLPTEQDQALNERHYGDLQGLNKAETAQKFGDEQVHIWRRSFDVRPPGGESLKDTAERTLPYYEKHIEPALKAGRNVLVVAHGNSLRSIVMHIDHMTPEQVVALNLATGVPVVYEFDGDLKVKSKKLLELQKS